MHREPFPKGIWKKKHKTNLHWICLPSPCGVFFCTFKCPEVILTYLIESQDHRTIQVGIIFRSSSPASSSSHTVHYPRFILWKSYTYGLQQHPQIISNTLNNPTKRDQRRSRGKCYVLWMCLVYAIRLTDKSPCPKQLNSVNVSYTFISALIG